MNQHDVFSAMRPAEDNLNAALRAISRVLHEADHEALIAYGGEDYCLVLARALEAIRDSAFSLGMLVEV